MWGRCPKNIYQNILTMALKTLPVMSPAPSSPLNILLALQQKSLLSLKGPTQQCDQTHLQTGVKIH